MLIIKNAAQVVPRATEAKERSSTYVRDDRSQGFSRSAFCFISVQTALACVNQYSASCQQFLLRCYFY
jgi:hypothetical protein